MYDVCGYWVEKVRVVDANQYAALTLLFDKRIDDAAHIGYRVVDGSAYQSGESAQWELSRGLGANYPVGTLTRCLGASEHLTREPGLAHSGGSDNGRAGTIAYSAESPTNDSRFAVAPESAAS